MTLLRDRGCRTLNAGHRAIEDLPDEAPEPMSKQTILAVEDEALLLDLLRTVLEKAGYRVLMARDGVEAIRLYAEHPSEVALVFADVALPKLGGWTMLLRLKEINPQVKIVLASGYLRPGAKSEMVRAGATDFVMKPYEPEEVLRVVRAALRVPD